MSVFQGVWIGKDLKNFVGDTEGLDFLPNVDYICYQQTLIANRDKR